MKTAKKKVAIIMVCFNRWSLTRLSLLSIFKNTHLPHTLTVVDNGSWDGTPEKLKHLKRTGKIDKVILLPKNVGIGRGKNYGLKTWKDKANWYACIDNDIEVRSPYWLSYMCYATNIPKSELGKYDGLGVVGSNVQGFGKRREYKWFKVTQWKTVNGVILDNCPNPGGIYVFNASTFKKLGYFREWSLYGLEDSNYHARQKHHNLRSVYVRNADCREMKDVRFKMPGGGNYRDFKTNTHQRIVKKNRLLQTKKKFKLFKHFETSITQEQIKKYTYKGE